jgi:hypothetical protein
MVFSGGIRGHKCSNAGRSSSEIGMLREGGEGR